MAETILRCAGLSKDYGTHVVTRVLHAVDFALGEGELTALIGPSGSGKSTLLNIVGLLDRPTTGKVFVRGQDVSLLGDVALTAFRGKNIGFVFQFHHLLPAFSAMENVMIPMMAAKGVRDEGMEECASALLTRVGLKERMRNRALDLSGGEQQRVAIARALAMNPPLLLADEPTGNLDTHTADEIFELIRQFNREEGMACLVVTHDPRIAKRCDRIVELVDGRIVSDKANKGS